MKVDFMIIGAQKCATTTLFDVLNRHPDLSGCREKEPHFFSKNPNWKENIESYHSLFDFKNDVKTFEASTTYTFLPQYAETVANLHDYNPELKFIYIVRKPQARVISAYRHLSQRGYLKGTISEVLRNSKNIINVSKYYFQIMHYIEKFGNDRVLILDFADLTSDRNSCLTKIGEFLNVDVDVFRSIPDIRSNTKENKKENIKLQRLNIWQKALSKYTPGIWRKIVSKFYRTEVQNNIALTDADNEYLKDQLLEDSLKLEKLMGKKLDWFE